MTQCIYPIDSSFQYYSMQYYGMAGKTFSPGKLPHWVKSFQCMRYFKMSMLKGFTILSRIFCLH